MKFFIFIALNLLLSSSSFATSIWNKAPRAEISENKKIVCVNRTYAGSMPLEFDPQYKLPLDEFSQKNYPESGVYELSTRKLLWRFNFESMSYCEPLDDGHYIIIRGSMGFSTDANAFAIYRDGKLVKKYSINDICDDRSFTRKMNRLVQWGQDYRTDNSMKTFSFYSCYRQKTVDLMTGAMTSSFILKGLKDYIINKIFEKMLYFFIFYFWFSHFMIPFFAFRYLKIINQNLYRNKYFKLFLKSCAITLCIGYLCWFFILMMRMKF